MPSVSRFPTTHTNLWDDSQRGLASDNSFATALPTASGVSVARYGTFGFDSAIPAGASIQTVTLEAKWKVSASSTGARLRLDALVNTVPTGPIYDDTSEPTAAVVRTTVPAISARSDLLDSAFEVRVRASRTDPVTASLDYVKATVSYTT